MKRRPWILRLAAAAAIVLTARLGFWQLDRAAHKLALQEQREQRAHAPPLDTAALPRTASAALAAEQRAVVTAGRWLPAHTVHLDNRPMSGRTGFFVVTPLELNGGDVLLVQRGWWPRDAADRARVDAPAPPVDPMQVRGRVALAPSRLFELAPDAHGPIRQNLDLAAFQRETRLPLLPWVLVQTEDAAAPAGDGLSRQWPEPAADVHKHYGYAVQWFGLSALVLLLLLWFQIVRPWRRGRTS